jgi:hypothetical protein
MNRAEPLLFYGPPYYFMVLWPLLFNGRAAGWERAEPSPREYLKLYGGGACRCRASGAEALYYIGGPIYLGGARR